MQLRTRLVLMVAVAALTLGVARPATAAAEDLNFTGTTLTGATAIGN